jgi:hypothetical protein
MNYNPKSIWKLLPAATKAIIEKRAGMTYRQYHARQKIAFFMPLVCLLGMIAWMFDQSPESLRAPVVIAAYIGIAIIFIISAVIDPRAEVHHAFYYRLATEEGIATSILQSELHAWEKPSPTILNICYLYLRTLGNGVQKADEWHNKGEAGETIREARMLHLKHAHGRLFKLGLAQNPDPVWYLSKQTIGG